MPTLYNYFNARWRDGYSYLSDAPYSVLRHVEPAFAPHSDIRKQPRLEYFVVGTIEVCLIGFEVRVDSIDRFASYLHAIILVHDVKGIMVGSDSLINCLLSFYGADPADTIREKYRSIAKADSVDGRELLSEMWCQQVPGGVVSMTQRHLANSSQELKSVSNTVQDKVNQSGADSSGAGRDPIAGIPAGLTVVVRGKSSPLDRKLRGAVGGGSIDDNTEANLKPTGAEPTSVKEGKGTSHVPDATANQLLDEAATDVIPAPSRRHISRSLLLRLALVALAVESLLLVFLFQFVPGNAIENWLFAPSKPREEPRKEEPGQPPLPRSRVPSPVTTPTEKTAVNTQPSTVIAVREQTPSHPATSLASPRTTISSASTAKATPPDPFMIGFSTKYLLSATEKSQILAAVQGCSSAGRGDALKAIILFDNETSISSHFERLRDEIVVSGFPGTLTIDKRVKGKDERSGLTLSCL